MSSAHSPGHLFSPSLLPCAAAAVTPKRPVHLHSTAARLAKGGLLHTAACAVALRADSRLSLGPRPAPPSPGLGCGFSALGWFLGRLFLPVHTASKRGELCLVTIGLSELSYSSWHRVRCSLNDKEGERKGGKREGGEE